MITRLDDWNWGEAFGCAGEPGHENTNLPDDCTERVPPTTTWRPVTREDVEAIIYAEDGEHDESDWVGLFRLKSGHYLALRAGCDYTGWDCRSGGSSSVHTTEADAIRFGLTEEERARLGLRLEVAK